LISAVQAQASWSSGLQVNLLASGYNRPLGGSTGSGIYHAQQGVLNYYMAETTHSKLLTAFISHSKSSKSNKFEVKSSKNTGLYTSRDILNKYNYVKLSNIYGIPHEISICHEKICCKISYQLNSITNKFNYHLLAYDGVRTHAEGRYASKLQVCSLVACGDDDNISSCTDGFKNSTYSTYTDFAYIQMKGMNFKTSRVLPNTLLSDTLGPVDYKSMLFHKFYNKDTNLYDIILEKSDIISSIHTFGIYTHDYEPNSGVNLHGFIWCLILAVLITLFS
jgi:hypothetical protein